MSWDNIAFRDRCIRLKTHDHIIPLSSGHILHTTGRFLKKYHLHTQSNRIGCVGTTAHADSLAHPAGDVTTQLRSLRGRLQTKPQQTFIIDKHKTGCIPAMAHEQGSNCLASSSKTKAVQCSTSPESTSPRLSRPSS